MNASRSELLSLLSEACELEHGLACAYLYAAFTIKQDTSEGGLTWQQLQLARLWAAQIYCVASEEMLHLAQVWNLLAAVGGTPYYFRPNFPQGCKYYPLGLALELLPFGDQSLRRFIFFERPMCVNPGDALRELSEAGSVATEETTYRSVGELYDRIRAVLTTIPERELVLGNPRWQVSQQLADFPQLVPVVNRQSALAAIDMIVSQGEGTQADRIDCHYGIFRGILKQLHSEKKHSPAFAPARPAVSNPRPRERANYSAGMGTVLRNPRTIRVADLFDEVYSLMLRMLQYVFSSGDKDETLVRRLATTSIRAMTMVIKPLGEALTQLESGIEGQTGGPAFALTRHVPLPLDGRTASTLVRERWDELTREATELAMAVSLTQLRAAATNMQAMQSALAGSET